MKNIVVTEAFNYRRGLTTTHYAAGKEEQAVPDAVAEYAVATKRAKLGKSTEPKPTEAARAAEPPPAN